MKHKYSDFDLEVAVAKSFNFCEVCRNLGIKNTGGNSYERVRNRIKSLGLNTSHFSGQRFFSLKNPRFINRKTVEQILTPFCENRRNHKILKRALIEIGVKYSCSICGISEWNGRPMTLDIDHINGDWSNCERDNLRFLCPNCHRQTPTYSGKNIKKSQDWIVTK